MSEDPPSDPCPEHVPLEEFDATRVQIAISPLATVFVFALGAIETREETAGAGPPEWKRTVRSHLRERDHAALAPLGDPRAGSWPDVLAGVRKPGVTTFDEGLEMILGYDLDQFAARVEQTCWQEQRLDSWLPVRRDPDSWRHAYVEALRRAWRGIEPLWERSQGLLQREVERVGAAVAVGAAAQCVNELHPRGTIEHGAWRPNMRFPRARGWRLAKEFVVAPLLVEHASFLSDDDADSLIRLHYPLQEAWRAFDGERPPPASLEGLLGAQRARILMHLERPATPGELADVMIATPGAATYQLRALESAGLITRRRDGRNVTVARTALGTSLLALYAG
jgi:DNA-binding transcriptional ArsR family regulator